MGAVVNEEWIWKDIQWVASHPIFPPVAPHVDGDCGAEDIHEKVDDESIKHGRLSLLLTGGLDS